MSGHKLRQGYGSRGLAYAGGRVFIATQDGRLIALDGKTGQPIWTTQTIAKDDNAYISGAPRVFDGKVIIGFGGADGGGVRGYVSCYDAASGRLLWRFYTVPGNPAVDHDETTRIAAKTWHGEWWKKGGGGTAWNGLTYDPELKRFYIGTGNGYPYNHVLRSPGGGDNLFLASIVAVDAATGKYIWHYQINPGEQWDYKTTQDITLATIPIDGKPRKVLLQAPTNGFFYVLDRTTGKLLSAKPFVKVTWASGIDMKTGRPIETPGARYHGKALFEMWPNIVGGHSWLPQSYSPKTGLVYIPTIQRGMIIGDKGLDLAKEQLPVHPANVNAGMGVTGSYLPDFKGQGSFLRAWDPVTQTARWSVALPGDWPGGTMATGGSLVFQGRIDNRFNAYDAKDGKLLWSYDTRSPVVAPPISYAVGGKQYVTVITGTGGAGGGYHGKGLQAFEVDYRTMARRVLTFAIGGTATLPPAPPRVPRVAPADPDFRRDDGLAQRGNIAYHIACGTCHGGAGMAAGTAPDLRISPIPASHDAFFSVVRDGALVPNGMPRFDDLPPDQIEAIRQYLRTLGQDLPKAK
jgi:quinohemoprotein ethanol dehydrogenase